MRRELWKRYYSQKGIPPFSCPKCKKGTLTYDISQMQIVETQYSKDAHSHADWDPDWVDEKFMLMMKCSAKACGEIVVVSGDTIADQVVDEEFGWVYEKMLRPKAIFPGIPIIDVDDEVPDDILKELNLAFQLFWSDLGASASRLRTSVERVLDDFKIPATKKGGAFLSLNDRIQEFKKIDPEHGETFDALRFVGNVGTHEGEVKWAAVLDAFEIYEDALEELFVRKKHKAKIDALKKKIIAAKGKYK